MTVQQFSAARGARPAERSVERLPGGLTREQIELCLAKGRRERSEAIVGGLARGFRALRRFFEDRSETPRGYRISGRVRP